MEWSFVFFLNSGLLGVGLAMDAFSVSLANGLHDPHMSRRRGTIIAAVTFFVCTAGLSLGKKFGTKLSGKASILGGVILIGIGLEIFVTGVLGL